MIATRMIRGNQIAKTTNSGDRVAFFMVFWLGVCIGVLLIELVRDMDRKTVQQWVISRDQYGGFVIEPK